MRHTQITLVGKVVAQLVRIVANPSNGVIRHVSDVVTFGTNTLEIVVHPFGNIAAAQTLNAPMGRFIDTPTIMHEDLAPVTDGNAVGVEVCDG